MKNIIICFLLFALLPLQGEAQTIRLSFKLIENAQGQLPQYGPGEQVLYDDIDRCVLIMNDIMEKYQRGIQFTHTVDQIGGNSLVTNYYNKEVNSDLRNDLENDAEDNPSLFKWKESSINIYINGFIADSKNKEAAGICSFPLSVCSSLNPFDADETILLTALELGTWGGARIVLHELGHFFNVHHTFSEPLGCRCDDTLPVESDWSLNELSQETYGNSYENLTAGQKNEIDDNYFNIMSYFFADTINNFEEIDFIRFSQCQLDQWQDAIRNNDSREAVVSTTPHFAKPDNSCSFINPCNGDPEGDEFPTIFYGDDAAYNEVDSQHELLILRKGTYKEEDFIWTKDCLIVSDGVGSAIIKN